ncbi:unnamed protein product [Cyprideis torosa]|uniref:Uncharacterized protein n=1 Tax=Cyprideis torosa TaxID=163714 RepID=A0A7R8W8C7_9CRUS|nr:unnamed protein product [Cyprideis torosa]CAG0884168.1 unnamed protein product [Cyprideis torosa]
MKKASRSRQSAALTELCLVRWGEGQPPHQTQYERSDDVARSCWSYGPEFKLCRNGKRTGSKRKLELGLARKRKIPSRRESSRNISTIREGCECSFFVDLGFGSFQCHPMLDNLSQYATHYYTVKTK